MATPASAAETGVTGSADVTGGVTGSADVTGDGSADALALSDSGGDCVVTVTPGDVAGAYAGGPRSVQIEGQVCLDRLVVGSVAGTAAHPVGITSSALWEAAPLWLLRADDKGGFSLVAQGSFDFPSSVRIVDFNADGVADFYGRVRGDSFSAWFGHSDGTREIFATTDDTYFQGDPDVSETTTPDGHAEVLLLDAQYATNSLRVLTEQGVTTLGSGEPPYLFQGRVDSATWQDVNADGWPDVQAAVAPCTFGGDYRHLCAASTFPYLQQHDRSFFVGASLQVAKEVMDLGDAVRVRVRINSVTHRPAPTGTMSFTIGDVPVGAPVEVRNGRAVASLVAPNPGEQVVVAHYSGDSLNPAFDSTPALIRVFAPSAISLVEPDLPTATGATWSGQVQLKFTPADHVPEGAYVFYVLDGVDKGWEWVGDDSRAAFSFSGLAPGKHSLVVTFPAQPLFGYADYLVHPSTLTVRHRVLPG